MQFAQGGKAAFSRDLPGNIQECGRAARAVLILHIHVVEQQCRGVEPLCPAPGEIPAQVFSGLQILDGLALIGAKENHQRRLFVGIDRAFIPLLAAGAGIFDLVIEGQRLVIDHLRKNRLGVVLRVGLQILVEDPVEQPQSAAPVPLDHAHTHRTVVVGVDRITIALFNVQIFHGLRDDLVVRNLHRVGAQAQSRRQGEQDRHQQAQRYDFFIHSFPPIRQTGTTFFPCQYTTFLVQVQSFLPDITGCAEKSPVFPIRRGKIAAPVGQFPPSVRRQRGSSGRPV